MSQNVALDHEAEVFYLVPEARLKTRGDTVFAVRAQKLWNKPPEEIRSAEAVTFFNVILEHSCFRGHFLFLLDFY